ncbi:hypothetical protein HBB16_19025 [Pseudonocardia sp. MCCB 268]|nr:hypothetical protein [Pseudonocardia cytotoxica]
MVRTDWSVLGGRNAATAGAPPARRCSASSWARSHRGPGTPRTRAHHGHELVPDSGGPGTARRPGAGEGRHQRSTPPPAPSCYCQTASGRSRGAKACRPSRTGVVNKGTDKQRYLS